MTTILPERAALLDTVTFATGSHTNDSGAMCVMEAAAYITGEPWSDHPQCVSPVIAEFLRNWNDSLPEPPRTALLRPLLPLVIGTRTTEADEQTRAWLATDWLMRVQAPAWMDLTERLQPHAAALRSLPPLTSADIATACAPVLDAAHYAAYEAARYAADGAADDAARDAAHYAARDAAQYAARAVARYAAYDAARYAAHYAAHYAARAVARYAAYEAARDAADDVLSPTVTTLQAAAVELVQRMCAVGSVALLDEPNYTAPEEH